MEDKTAQSRELGQQGRRRAEAENASSSDSRNGRRPASAKGASDGTKRREPDLVRLERIPAAREMMLAVMNAPPAEVHLMIMHLQKEYPGRTPGNIRDAFRRVRDDRRGLKGKHATLSEEEITILRAGYAAGVAAARAARKEVLKQRSDLNRNQVDRIVRQLGLCKYRGRVQRWSHEDHGYLMFWSEEKSVDRLAARFKRTEAAIRGRLSRYGARARVRIQRGYTVRDAAALLGVSRTAISMWVAKGELQVDPRRNSRAITENALQTFCKRHPERIDRRLCAPKALRWLPTPETDTGLKGRRGHLAHSHICPKCGRTIRGNGYSTHAKFCGIEPEPSGLNVQQSSVVIQVLSEG